MNKYYKKYSIININNYKFFCTLYQNSIYDKLSVVADLVESQIIFIIIIIIHNNLNLFEKRRGIVSNKIIILFII